MLIGPFATLNVIVVMVLFRWSFVRRDHFIVSFELVHTFVRTICYQCSMIFERNVLRLAKKFTKLGVLSPNDV